MHGVSIRSQHSESIGKRVETVTLRTLAVVQSHYIPWAGFFDLIGGCSDIVILGSVSYSKNSYFNRNRLIGPNGIFWLTIPVRTDGRFGQPISDVEISDDRWAKKHMRSVEQSLGHARYFDQVWESWGDAYANCCNLQKLSDVNHLWLELVMTQLALTSKVHRDSSISIPETNKNSRLIGICRHFGAEIYRTGPRGLDYLDVAQFKAAGITVETIEYANYYPYRATQNGDTDPVSVLENLAYMGTRAPEILRHSYRKVKV